MREGGLASLRDTQTQARFVLLALKRCCVLAGQTGRHGPANGRSRATDTSSNPPAVPSFDTGAKGTSWLADTPLKSGPSLYSALAWRP